MASIRYREALREALIEELSRDDRVFVMGEHVGYTSDPTAVTEGLLARFGESRIRDTPRADATLTAVAIGAAIGGLVPIVAMRTAELAMAAAPLLARQGALPIVLRAPLDQHVTAAIAVTASFSRDPSEDPSVRVVAPASVADAKGMLKSAVRSGGPVIVLEDRAGYETPGEAPPGDDYLAPLEGARVLRHGTDLTIFACSNTVSKSERAASMLDANGVSAEVIDLRSICPLDIATVAISVKKTRRVILASAGLAESAIAEAIYRAAFESLTAPIAIVVGDSADEIARAAVRPA